MTNKKFMSGCAGMALAFSLMVSTNALAGHIGGIAPPPPEAVGLPAGTNICEVNPFSFAFPDEPFFFDGADGVTITLTPTERELIDLAVPGFITALQKESEGSGPAGFLGRAGGLDWFANISVPCIFQKVNHDSDGNALGEFDSADITFNSFERVGVNLMTSIWNSRNGVMAHHMAGCIRSKELGHAASANLCNTFAPLADAVETLFKKVTKDQRD